MSAADAGAGATIARFPEKLAIVRLGPGSEVPAWAESSSVFSVTATATETTVLCAGRNVPTKVPGTKGLTGFQVAGPVAFDDGAALLVGLLSPVAEMGVGAAVVTTADTRWVLVPAADADRVEQEWRRRGHTVAPAVPA